MVGTRRALAVITTSPYQVALFLKPHLEEIGTQHRVTVYTNTEDQYRHLLREIQHLDIRHTPITRSQRLTVKDTAATAQLGTRLRRDRARTVVTMSPKAGFIGQTAAFGAGVPNRLHIYTGQVWDSMTSGVKRSAAILADRTIAHLATDLAADSRSQAAHLARKGIVPAQSEIVVPNPAGAIRGIDVGRFQPNAEVRTSVRREIGIPEDATCFVQVGRITADKGIHDLVEAFSLLRRAWHSRQTPNEPVLLLVGEDEDGVAAEFATREGVHVLPFSDEPERIFAASDITVLASYREGFPLCIIEGAACGTPAIGTDISGTRDAITPATGWLVPPRSPDLLAQAMLFANDNPEGVHTMGRAARSRAEDEYSSRAVSRRYADHILSIHQR